MKAFIVILVIALAGFGAWALWSYSINNTNVVYESSSPTNDLTANYTPTPEIDDVAIPTPISYSGTGGAGGTPAPRAPIFATVTAMNSSREHGVVALTANSNDQAVISFNLVGTPGGVFQHAFIVNGTCANIGSSVYALQPLMNGYSSTTLNADFLDIAQSKTSLSVVVYAPDGQFPNPWACGQLR